MCLHIRVCKLALIGFSQLSVFQLVSFFYGWCLFLPLTRRIFFAFACFSVNRITRKIVDEFWWNLLLKLTKTQPLFDSAMENLFRKMQSADHCLHTLLPPDRPLSNILSTRDKDLELPRCSLNLNKRSFVINCLFKFIDMWTCFYLRMYRVLPVVICLHIWPCAGSGVVRIDPLRFLPDVVKGD